MLNMHHRAPHHNTGGRRLAPRRTLMRLLLLSMVVLSAPLHALELEGIKLADQAEVGGRQLQLNGAGLRSKFFVSVYVGGLYLVGKSSDVQQILSMPGPKRVAMHFIYDEISEAKIRDAWKEGFADNNSEEVMAQIKPEMDAFNSLWPEIKGGDIALVDFLPGKGTQISLNGKVRGIVPGDQFQRAALRIWLGDNPVDSDLKAGMLGAQ